MLKYDASTSLKFFQEEMKVHALFLLLLILNCISLLSPWGTFGLLLLSFLLASTHQMKYANILHISTIALIGPLAISEIVKWYDFYFLHFFSRSGCTFMLGQLLEEYVFRWIPFSFPLSQKCSCSHVIPFYAYLLANYYWSLLSPTWEPIIMRLLRLMQVPMPPWMLWLLLVLVLQVRGARFSAQLFLLEGLCHGIIFLFLRCLFNVYRVRCLLCSICNPYSNTWVVPYLAHIHGWSLELDPHADPAFLLLLFFSWFLNFFPWS